MPVMKMRITRNNIAPVIRLWPNHLGRTSPGMRGCMKVKYLLAGVALFGLLLAIRRQTSFEMEIDPLEYEEWPLFQ